jgi:hypothetical protein
MRSFINIKYRYYIYPGVLAARSRRGDSASGGNKRNNKKIEIAGIIITASFIASSSTIIITGFILEAFVGFFLRGAIIFWVNLGFLLLAK